MNAHGPDRFAAVDPSARLAPGADEPWWTLSAGAARTALLDADGRPVLLGAARDDLVAALRARVGGFTPDWTGTGPDDAGDALLRLFALMAEAVAARVDRLPAKLLVEHLRIAGVSPLPAAPAQVLLRLTATAAAGAGVQVPAGFQAGAPGEDGTEVVMETVDDMWVSPAELTSLAVGRPATGILPGPVDEVTPGQDPCADGFLPFGARSAPGSALWLGFTAPQALEGGLSLAFVAAPRPGGPAAAARGAVAPPEAAPPQLRWSVLDGDTFRAADVVVDHTGNLAATGTVQLRLPTGWRPGRPPGGAQLPEARWLRVRLTAGTYAEPPRLAAVLPHTVLASAVRTVRDEVLSPAPADPREQDGGAGVRLRRGDGARRSRIPDRQPSPTTPPRRSSPSTARPPPRTTRCPCGGRCPTWSSRAPPTGCSRSTPTPASSPSATGCTGSRCRPAWAMYGPSATAPEAAGRAPSRRTRPPCCALRCPGWLR